MGERLWVSRSENKNNNSNKSYPLTNHLRQCLRVCFPFVLTWTVKVLIPRGNFMIPNALI